MPHVNILFHAPESMHDAIKNHCHEQRITLKSFIQFAIAEALRDTPHAIPTPPLKKKATASNDYEETAPKRNHRIKS